MKLAMFLPADESSWLSCRQILKSLVELYSKEASFQIKRFVLPANASLVAMDRLARQVVDQEFDALVFPAHKPHPHDFLIRWNRLDQRTPLIFHAYGDFAVDVRQWLRLENVFQTHPIRIFAASRRQQKFLSSLVDNPNLVARLPFSPDQENFNYQTGLGEKLRHERGVADDEWIFLYSGRLSRQKHILELTTTFDRFISKIFPRAQLWLAGEFDDLGMPYIGRTELTFEHYQRWLAIHDSSQAAARIHYLGKLSKQELAQVAQAADWGVFPSTHNDEDFGLAPLELLMSGTPCFLSDWGGLADFMHEGDTKSILVEMKNFMITPDFSRLIKDLFLLTTKGQRPSVKERLQRAQRYHQLYNQSQLLLLLKNSLQKQETFGAFSQKMQRLGEAFTRNPYAPFVDVQSLGGYNRDFEELYAPYFGRD